VNIRTSIKTLLNEFYPFFLNALYFSCLTEFCLPSPPFSVRIKKGALLPHRFPHGAGNPPQRSIPALIS
jgi:hypothetical protein